MLLEVRHVTQYHYDAPVRESVMELWMQPQKSARQRLVRFDLETQPDAQLFSYADTFGNAVYYFDVPQPHQELTIIACACVETTAPEPLPDALDMHEWDRLSGDFVRGDCFDFLRPHAFAQNPEALRRFAARKMLDALKRHDPLTAVRRLNEIIYSSFDYQAGVTEADSPIDEALEAGRGVCQDFTHIMLAICRSWGIPARYVSGYLFNDKKHGDRSDPDATHAWVEVFLPSLRWVGFDPTNNCLAQERHIAVAVGRDYRDVPPSRGVYKGGGDSHLGVAVSVRKARAALSEPEFPRLQRAASQTGARQGAPAPFDHDHQRQQQQQ
ncbi:MAG TPA: transglutaminase family protein [Caulobacteraceae bacterium]